LSVSKGKPATWEEELTKEAPADYILNILWKTFPRAVEIDDNRDKHVSGCDWRITWETSHVSEIDDKNDLNLGVTGNICLDKATTDKEGGIQLFVNYPRFTGKYLFVYNALLRWIDLEHWIHERQQPWGGTTKAYIVPVENLNFSIYKSFPEIVNPNIEFFTRKRKTIK